jgi:hypothetical protein
VHSLNECDDGVLQDVGGEAVDIELLLIFSEWRNTRLMGGAITRDDERNDIKFFFFLIFGEFGVVAGVDS